VWEHLSEEEQEKTIKATPMAFQVFAKNPIGRTKAFVRMFLLRPPQDLVFRHSQVTYQVAQSKVLESAAAKGWRPLDFGPIDLVRTEDSNGPKPTIDAGSRFMWAASAEAPTVAGVAADIAGRWPLFSVTHELPKGLSLNRITGEIEGAAEDEVEGVFKSPTCVKCSLRTSASAIRVSAKRSAESRGHVASPLMKDKHRSSSEYPCVDNEMCRGLKTFSRCCRRMKLHTLHAISVGSPRP
jgi:hypothetical protein